MQKYAIITAGGSGSRAQTEIPKQFIPIAGKPVLMHAIDKFREYDAKIKIVLSLPEDYVELWHGLVKEFNFQQPCDYVIGGSTRFESVKNALNSISGDGIIAVHDGARPLVSVSTIERCFALAQEEGNAIPVMPVNESLRQLEEDSSKIVDRSQYRLVQTPQCFRLPVLQRAYCTPYQASFTDDASVLEHLGEKIHLTEGNPENIKITWSADIKIAQALLKPVL